MQLVVGSAQLVPGQLVPAATQPSTYDVGDLVLLTLDVYADDGVALEPTGVTVTTVAPDESTSTPTIKRAGVAKFTALLTVTAAGIWRARWVTTGPGAGVAEWAFVVEAEGSALPYAASVEGVRARVLDVARPTGAAPAGGTARADRVSNARITEWLLEAGARVGRKLRLIDKMGSGPTDPVRLEYRAAARGLTELYAAALLWDATYPQAAKGERYGAVLYDRYSKGLVELAADLAADFDAQIPDTGVDTTGEGAAGVDDGLRSVTIDPYDLRPGYGGGYGDVVVGGAGASARFPAPDPRITRHRPW